LVSVIAAAMARTQNATILDLVAFAWAGFGASFGPAVLLALYWPRLTTAGALVGMVAGAVTVGWWGQAEGGLLDLYEIVPGFLLNTVLAVVVSHLTHRDRPEITGEFDETQRALRTGSAVRPAEERPAPE